MYKQGQAEDFFADLIPAIALTFIALLVIVVAGYMHERSARAAFEADMARLSASDFNTFLRAPAPMPELEKHGYKGMSAAEAIILIDKAAQDREKYGWMWEEGILRGDDTVLCGDNLLSFIDAHFNGYNAWQLWTSNINCWRFAERTLTPYSTIPEEEEVPQHKSEALLPTSEASSPVKVEFRGYVEAEE